MTCPPKLTSPAAPAASSIGPQPSSMQAYLSTIAAKKGVPLSELANDLLKKEIAILETIK
jgi:hypothetical protein